MSSIRIFDKKHDHTLHFRVLQKWKIAVLFEWLILGSRSSVIRNLFIPSFQTHVILPFQPFPE